MFIFWLLYSFTCSNLIDLLTIIVDNPLNILTFQSMLWAIIPPFYQNKNLVAFLLLQIIIFGLFPHVLTTHCRFMDVCICTIFLFYFYKLMRYFHGIETNLFIWALFGQIWISNNIIMDIIFVSISLYFYGIHMQYVSHVQARFECQQNRYWQIFSIFTKLPKIWLTLTKWNFYLIFGNR